MVVLYLAKHGMQFAAQWHLPELDKKSHWWRSFRISGAIYPS